MPGRDNHPHRDPVNLELVTLAEDHAVVTWYTGRADTDDGRSRPSLGFEVWLIC
ncbi:MAG TPA: hypothetical protein VFX16_32945 [Pseudonocardiaceae bacterium]|nr:hypothetical protein [Pseudonocardiaceae bacterium]